MDVTGRNFVEALAIVKSLLPTATFASIDLEFTGLGESKPSQLDTPPIRYETVRADAETFPPIQLGLSIFRLAQTGSSQYNRESSPSSGKCDAQDALSSLPPAPQQGNGAETPALEPAHPAAWEVATFNFNIFPHAVYFPSTTRYPYYDRIVQLQSSSIHFLMHHGFDFSKLFTNGISWVRGETEANLRKHISSVLEKKYNPTAQSKIAISAEGKKVVEFYREAIGEWVQTVGKDQAKVTEPGELQTPFIKMFTLPRTPGQRRLVFDLISNEFPRVFASTMATQDRTQLKMELYASAADVAEKRDSAMCKEIEEEVSKAVGFRYVIDTLRESKLPIVIHNGLMDLSKLLANFVAPLPAHLDEFKEQVSAAFPFLYDTRWMMQHLCDTNEAVRRAINADNARSMDEVIRTLRRLIAKVEKTVPPEIRTLIPGESVEWRSGHINEAVLSSKGKGTVIKAGVNSEFPIGDRFGFGRYASGDEREFSHEAGFDAVETGKLFTMLLQLSKVDCTPGAFDLACDELATFRNRVYLGSCGGFRCINLLTRNQPEENVYLLKGNAVVASGESKEENGAVEDSAPHRRRRRLLLRITAGTGCDVEKSMIVSAARKTTMVVLSRNTKGQTIRHGKRKHIEDTNFTQEVQAVIKNGEDIGVKVISYADALSSQTATDYKDLKKRRCA